jgi:hypothetical protein
VVVAPHVVPVEVCGIVVRVVVYPTTDRSALPADRRSHAEPTEDGRALCVAEIIRPGSPVPSVALADPPALART